VGLFLLLGSTPWQGDEPRGFSGFDSDQHRLLAGRGLHRPLSFAAVTPTVTAGFIVTMPLQLF
jgi:hypothetical protein